MPADNQGRVRPDILVGARVHLTTPQSIPTGVRTKIVWDTLDWDVGKMWNSGDELRVKRNGRYQVNLVLGLVADSNTFVNIAIANHAGNILSEVQVQQADRINSIILCVSGVFLMKLGDGFTAYLLHDAGLNVNCTTESAGNFSAQWVGEP